MSIKLLLKRISLSAMASDAGPSEMDRSDTTSFSTPFDTAPVDITLLRELVAAIRPNQANDITLASDRLHALCYMLTSHPRYATALRSYLFNIISTRKIVHLCTDTGITLSESFWSAAESSATKANTASVRTRPNEERKSARPDSAALFSRIFFRNRQQTKPTSASNAGTVRPKFHTQKPIVAGILTNQNWIALTANPGSLSTQPGDQERMDPA